MFDIVSKKQIFTIENCIEISIKNTKQTIQDKVFCDVIDKKDKALKDYWTFVIDEERNY